MAPYRDTRCVFRFATRSCANSHSSASARSRAPSATMASKSPPSPWARSPPAGRRRGAVPSGRGSGRGIAITGLHYLLLAPEGLSITTEASAQYQRSIEVMRRLCDLAADLGAGVLVHGSPAQRQLEVGKEAEGRKARSCCFAAAAEAAGKAGVTYCIEPSPPRKPSSSTRSRKRQRSCGRSRTRPCGP